MKGEKERERRRGYKSFLKWQATTEGSSGREGGAKLQEAELVLVGQWTGPLSVSPLIWYGQVEWVLMDWFLPGRNQMAAHLGEDSGEGLAAWVPLLIRQDRLAMPRLNSLIRPYNYYFSKAFVFALCFNIWTLWEANNFKNNKYTYKNHSYLKMARIISTTKQSEDALPESLERWPIKEFQALSERSFSTVDIYWSLLYRGLWRRPCPVDVNDWVDSCGSGWSLR